MTKTLKNTLPPTDWESDVRAVFPEWLTDATVEKWTKTRDSLKVGQAVSGNVISRAPFGVWLDIGVSHPALLLVVNMEAAKIRRITFEDYPKKGTLLHTRINALGERGEIGLTQFQCDDKIDNVNTES